MDIWVEFSANLPTVSVQNNNDSDHPLSSQTSQSTQPIWMIAQSVSLPFPRIPRTVLWSQQLLTEKDMSACLKVIICSLLH